MNDSLIIGLGSGRDPASLHLYTLQNRTRIENVRPAEELCTEGLEAAYKYVKSVSPTAKCRSLTAMYNCVGLVFATRRTSIETKHMNVILRDDGYRPVSRENAVEGDVVIYTLNNVATHVGIIHRKETAFGVTNIWVLSQWGDCGEYVHPIIPVPEAYGRPTDFWTERRSR